MFFIQVVRGRQRKFELRFRDFVDESTLLGGHGNAARTAAAVDIRLQSATQQHRSLKAVCLSVAYLYAILSAQ